MVLLACEDPAEFELILGEYRAMYQPATAAEQDLVDEMVAARWRIRRLWTIETCLLDSEMLSVQSPLDATGAARQQPEAPADPGVHLARAFRTLADDSRSLALTSRYEARLHRIHDRAFETFRSLQHARLEINRPEFNKGKTKSGPRSLARAGSCEFTPALAGLERLKT